MSAPRKPRALRPWEVKSLEDIDRVNEWDDTTKRLMRGRWIQLGRLAPTPAQMDRIRRIMRPVPLAESHRDVERREAS